MTWVMLKIQVDPRGNALSSILGTYQDYEKGKEHLENVKSLTVHDVVDFNEVQIGKRYVFKLVRFESKIMGEIKT